ncbi:MAG: hypothetical protein U0031_13570 [Thermomicrobiales bacterium]
MSKVSYKRLGMALVSVAVPFMVAGSVAAAPTPVEVSSVANECILGLGIDISTCSGAVTEGVYDVIETETNGSLSDQGVDYSIDLGAPSVVEPGNFPYDINAIAVNPLPPLPPAPIVPVGSSVPFQ